MHCLVVDLHRCSTSIARLQFQLRQLPYIFLVASIICESYDLLVPSSSVAECVSICLIVGSIRLRHRSCSDEIGSNQTDVFSQRFGINNIFVDA